MADFFALILVILIAAGFIWLSIKFLKFLFVTAKKTVGWVGPYLVSAVPASGAYIVTHTLFGAGHYAPTLAGFLTAAIAGTFLGAS